MSTGDRNGVFFELAGVGVFAKESDGELCTGLAAQGIDGDAEVASVKALGIAGAFAHFEYLVAELYPCSGERAARNNAVDGRESVLEGERRTNPARSRIVNGTVSALTFRDVGKSVCPRDRVIGIFAGEDFADSFNDRVALLRRFAGSEKAFHGFRIVGGPRNENGRGKVLVEAVVICIVPLPRLVRNLGSPTPKHGIRGAFFLHALQLAVR